MYLKQWLPREPLLLFLHILSLTSFCLKLKWVKSCCRSIIIESSQIITIVVTICILWFLIKDPFYRCFHHFRNKLFACFRLVIRHTYFKIGRASCRERV